MCRNKDIAAFEKISLFNEYMRMIFEGYPKAWCLNRQLEFYMLHFIKMGLNKVFRMQCKKVYQLTYKQLINCRKIVLYGAGVVGKSYYEQLEEQSIWDIVLWIDKKYNGGTIKDSRIGTINKLKQTEYDKVLIAVKDEDIAFDIKQDLIREGVEEEKIIWVEPIMKVSQFRTQIDESMDL